MWKLLNHIDRNPLKLSAWGGFTVFFAQISAPDLILRLGQIGVTFLTIFLLVLTAYRKTFGSQKLKKPVIELLLIDDNEQDRRLFSRAFTRAGCNVTAVNGWREAMEVIHESKRLDLVLLDIIIPSEKPEETLSRIKTARPFLPCAIYSGVPASPEVQEAVKSVSPGTGFFMKDSHFDEFADNLIATLKIGAPH